MTMVIGSRKPNHDRNEFLQPPASLEQTTVFIGRTVD